MRTDFDVTLDQISVEKYIQQVKEIQHYSKVICSPAVKNK